LNKAVAPALKPAKKYLKDFIKAAVDTIIQKRLATFFINNFN
jgi:hypothetical protein